MWTALAMMAALSQAPAQGGKLELTNVRPTLGLYGATRKDADNPKVLIGDAFVVSFDIDGLKVGDDGRVQYAVGMELRDSKDKLLYREEPQPLEIINSLGGSRVPAFVATEIGTDTPPGEYTLKAIVKDRAGNTETSLIRKFEVVPLTFGLVRLVLSYDDRGTIPAPPLAVPGQRLLVGFLAVGFERDQAKKQPSISFKMRVLQDGKPVLGKDASGVVKEAPATAKVIPANFFLYLNRAGKYTVELEATDDLSKKKAVQTFDLTVVEPK